MAKIASVIGRDDDARKYQTLLRNIKAAFNEAYVTPDGRILGENRGRRPGDAYEQIPGTDTQTAYLLALGFDLLPEDKKPPAVKHLLERIEERDWHLSTGFLGTPLLLPVLTQVGHLDLAYQLLQTDTFPSWGYFIKTGATTMYEAWDGCDDNGFKKGSLNHFAFGVVCEWLQRFVAGIDADPQRPGYKHIIFHPRPGGGITFARATYNSIHGMIVSDWKIEDGGFRWRIRVPVNTTATVYVPAKDSSLVAESGRPADRAQGVRFIGMEDDRAVYAVGSGTYEFAVNEGN